MMRILVAVNDSPAGLAAARTAVHLAQQSSGRLRAVTVCCIPGPSAHPCGDHRPASAAPVLRYVDKLAGRAGVDAETATVEGQPARAILAEAAAWRADVIVLGRSGVRHVGQPFVGSQVMHVLEFAEVPVLVVPA